MTVRSTVLSESWDFALVSFYSKIECCWETSKEIDVQDLVRGTFTGSGFVRWAKWKPKRIRPMMFFEVPPRYKILRQSSPIQTKDADWQMLRIVKQKSLNSTKPGELHERRPNRISARFGWSIFVLVLGKLSSIAALSKLCRAMREKTDRCHYFWKISLVEEWKGLTCM